MRAEVTGLTVKNPRQKTPTANVLRVHCDGSTIPVNPPMQHPVTGTVLVQISLRALDTPA
jgi:hypothetical protein